MVAVFLKLKHAYKSSWTHSIRLGNFRNSSLPYEACTLTQTTTQMHRQNRSISTWKQKCSKLCMCGEEERAQCLGAYTHIPNQCEKGGNWQRRTINYRNNQIIFSLPFGNDAFMCTLTVCKSTSTSSIPSVSIFWTVELCDVRLLTPTKLMCSALSLLIRFSKCISQNFWCSTNKVVRRRYCCIGNAVAINCWWFV